MHSAFFQASVGALLAMLLSACSETEPPAPKEKTESRVSEDSPFSAQVQALEKAENVENVINESLRKRESQLSE